MSGRTLNLWTEAEDTKLAELRARGVKWLNIPRHMPGRTIQACQQRILYLKAKAAGKRKGSGGARRQASKLKAKAATAGQREKLARQALAYAAAKAELLAAEERAAELRCAAAEAASPSRKRRLSTHVLVTDAELRSRIETQGLTAGLFGDPLPGRSALDKRNSEAVT